MVYHISVLRPPRPLASWIPGLVLRISRGTHLRFWPTGAMKIKSSIGRSVYRQVFFATLAALLLMMGAWALPIGPGSRPSRRYEVLMDSPGFGGVTWCDSPRQVVNLVKRELGQHWKTITIVECKEPCGWNPIPGR